jgi:hypothetical protein
MRARLSAVTTVSTARSVTCPALARVQPRRHCEDEHADHDDQEEELTRDRVGGVCVATPPRLGDVAEVDDRLLVERAVAELRLGCLHGGIELAQLLGRLPARLAGLVDRVQIVLEHRSVVTDDRLPHLVAS